MSVTTPSQGQKISDYSPGTVDANSFLIQARNGSTEKISATQIGQYSNLNLLFSGTGGLDTTNKTIVGAINEVNDKNIGDINDVNLSSPAEGDAFIYDDDSGKWINKKLKADAIDYDHTSSSLTATDVQAAIDEVNSGFVDNVCKGRTVARFTEITSSTVIKITRTTSLQTYLVIVRGTNAASYYVGLITGYGGGSPRNAIVELGKGNNIGTVSFLTSDSDDLTLSISMASSSISASLNVLVIPYQSDDTFAITKT